MKLSLNGLYFRPEEGTVLDTQSLAAIAGAEHASLLTLLYLNGQPKQGMVLSGLRVQLINNRLKVTEGVALLPDGEGQLVVALHTSPADLPLPARSPAMLVASLSEKRLMHGPSSLRGAAKAMRVQLELVPLAELQPERQLPVAQVDLELGQVENDVCRLLQPDEPEVLELVRRLRAIINARLVQEGTRGQLEFQGQVQESLSARDFLYVSALQAAILQLRSRPALSVERVRMVSELALQVRTLYRQHPRLREFIREIVAVGYVDHEHARQLRMESAAARFHNLLNSGGLEGEGRSGDGAGNNPNASRPSDREV